MEINTLEALAIAVAAYEHNGNIYIKDDTWCSTNGPVKWSNKNILRAYYNVDHYSGATEKPPLLKITDAHKNTAEQIRLFTKKLLFKSMAFDRSKGEFPPYDISIFQKVNQENITTNDLGFIASAPKYFYTEQFKNEVAERSKSSQHVGQIGGRISLDDFEVVSIFWSNKYNGFSIKGICDDNLFLFFTTKAAGNLKVQDKINVKGKIKDHILEKETFPMTKLTYVSIEGISDESANNIRTNNDSNVFG